MWYRRFATGIITLCCFQFATWLHKNTEHLLEAFVLKEKHSVSLNVEYRLFQFQRAYIFLSMHHLYVKGNSTV